MTYRSVLQILIFLLVTQTVLAGSIVINSIDIQGNVRTHENVILRELTFKRGDTVQYSELSEQLLTSENRIRNLNLFNAVECTMDSTGGVNVVTIKLVEKWYVWPIPFLEFSDRNFNVWQNLDFNPKRTNYGLYLFNYNLFGRNHTLKLSAIKGYNTRYGLEYRIPFISKSSKLGLQLIAYHKSQNEVWCNTVNDRLTFFSNGENDLFIEDAFFVKLHRRVKTFYQLGLELSRTHNRIDSAVLLEPLNFNFLLNNAYRQSISAISISAAYDKRDNIYLPLEGAYFKITQNAEIYNKGDALNLKWTVVAQKFSPINERFYTALSLSGQLNTNKNLPYNNYRQLGYVSTLRGFEQYVVDGHSSFLLNSALRYHAVKNKVIPLAFVPFRNYSFLPLNILFEGFIDIGGSSSNRYISANKLPNTVLVSTGIGMQTLFYNDRVVRFEYSFNSLGQGGLFIHFKKAI